MVEENPNYPDQKDLGGYDLHAYWQGRAVVKSAAQAISDLPGCDVTKTYLRDMAYRLVHSLLHHNPQQQCYYSPNELSLLPASDKVARAMAPEILTTIADGTTQASAAASTLTPIKNILASEGTIGSSSDQATDRRGLVELKDFFALNPESRRTGF